MFSSLQPHLVFGHFQGVVLGASRTQPEVLNALLLANRKTEKPAPIQTHEQLGAAGIGALGNHCQGR